MIQCKGLQGKKVFIKPRSDALANMKVLASADHGTMVISHLFMYRDPIPNMKSIATMFNMAQKTAFLLPIKKWVMPFLMMIAEEAGELVSKRFCCCSSQQFYFTGEGQAVQEEFDRLESTYNFSTAMCLCFYISHMLFVRDKPRSLQWHILKYENFVSAPDMVTKSLLEFLWA